MSAPAFPLAHSHIDLEDTNWESANGMSLRDYFAAKAMQAMLAVYCDPTDVYQSDSSQEETFTITARRARQMADAMMKAREA